VLAWQAATLAGVALSPAADLAVPLEAAATQGVQLVAVANFAIGLIGWSPRR